MSARAGSRKVGGLLPAGLPGPLPAGERMLWQGQPRWQSVALRVLHVRKLAIYFAILLAWYVVAKLAGGMAVRDVAIGTAELAGVAAAPLALMTGYSWAVGRTTVYTVTNRRVLMKFGVGFSITMNVPFAKIDGAALKLGADGIGDIALDIARSERLSYIVIWPHVRSLFSGRTKPTLLALPDAERAAQIIGRALAASADMAVQPAAAARPQTAAAGSRAAAAA
jgi:hypothetical protein